MGEALGLTVTQRYDGSAYIPGGVRASQLAGLDRLDLTGLGVQSVADLADAVGLRILNLAYNPVPNELADAAGILYTGDLADGPAQQFRDALTGDGEQTPVVNRNVSSDTNPADVRFGDSSLAFGAASTPNFNTLTLPGTTELGTSFTLAAFVRASASKYTRLFSSFRGSGAVTDGELLFDFNPVGAPAGNYSMRFFVHGLELDVNQTQFSDSEWHHLAATYDNGAVAIYLDGSLVGSGTLGSGAVSLTNNLRVGEDIGGTPNEQLTGNADDVLMLRTALTADQVAQLASDGAEALLAPETAAWLDALPDSLVNIEHLDIASTGAEQITAGQLAKRPLLRGLYVEDNAIGDLGGVSGDAVIDDGDAGYSETGTGWVGNVSEVAAAYDGDYRFHAGGEAGGAASFRFDNLVGGQYELFLTFPASDSQTTAAPVRVLADGMEVATLTVDQRFSPGVETGGETFDGRSWVSLGTYAAAGTITVEVLADGGGIVAADAARIAAVCSPAPDLQDARGRRAIR